MRKNNNLREAKRAKNDEFYTQLSDIEREMRYYRPHFAGKTILCNCNDALHTGFATHFSLMFEVYGLKELICTSFNPDGQGMVYRYHGDTNENGVPDIEEWDKMPMEGNGGFNTPEGIALIQEADIIVTNPPFSLFREFIALLMEHNKKFLVIGNVNAISYKELFPLIKENKLWLGVSITSGDRAFNVPDDYPLEAAGCGVDNNGKRFIRVKGVRWFTNLDNNKRHEPLDLYKRYTPEEFPKYDNYDAIEVSKTCDIPLDYDGIMGVPITFLDKYCPEQFEIVGGFNGYKESDEENGLLCGTLTEYIDKNGKVKMWTGPTINKQTKYYRILIKSK